MTTEKSKFQEPATPNLGEIVQAWIEGKQLHGYIGEQWIVLRRREADDERIPAFSVNIKYRVAPEPHWHRMLIQKWTEAPDEYVLEWQSRDRCAWFGIDAPSFQPQVGYRLRDKDTGTLVMESPAKPD